MIILKAIGALVAFLLIIIIAWLFLGIAIYIIKIFHHKCTSCRHIMRYKGTFSDRFGTYHVFHCSHCNKDEYIPVTEF